jgi:1-deoxy-D-xylulose-5-phosphate reductoisomerase
MENVVILGSTGSIGRNSLDIIDKLKHRFRIVGLAAGRNTQLLEVQVKKFRPKVVSLRNKEEAEALRKRFKDKSVQVTFGEEGAEDVASFAEGEIVVSAITGTGGLRPTLAAVKSGKKVALANKESMVVAGAFIQAMARKYHAQIIPVDSEHSGVFQCLAKEKMEKVKRVILTASGGPFFKTTIQAMTKATLEQALNHPRWKMGKKVTVDSATLMNKGLELIEARWLFGLKPGQLDVLIHPQSVVHSLVEMCDGSVLAQLSPTDMRIPIQYALTFPDREESQLPSLDLAEIRNLEFFQVDMKKFPLFSLARLVLEEGESFPVALNAANEVAVSAFLRERIKFMAISEIVNKVIDSHHKREVKSLADVFEVDREAREQSENLVAKWS